MICVSSICCFIRFQYDLKYASSDKPWFSRHVPFQIHDTRKQWSVFRQSVVLSGFNMTWYTKRHNPDVTPNGEKVHPTCKKYWQWSPFVKKLQISCRFTNTISPFSKIFSIPKWCTKRHNPDVTPNGEKVHPTCKKYWQWSPLCQEALNQLQFYHFNLSIQILTLFMLKVFPNSNI